VELSFDKPGARRGILALSIVIALILIYQGARLWVADALIRSENPKTIARGVALEPGNGDAWDRLGRFHQWDFINPNPAGAAREYSQAAHDDPNSAHFLMDLASAYEAMGDRVRANEAWNRARTVYPASAEVQWNYGNYLLRQQDLTDGYAMIRGAVVADPKLLPLAISRTWRATQDIQALLNQALPATAEAYEQALAFFASAHNANASLEVWRRLISLKKPIVLSKTFSFFQMLIDQDRSDEARQAWIEALQAASLPHELPQNNSLVWNGDFSSDFQNGGLGWRWENPVGTSFDFETPPPGHPGRSVRIEFIGGINLDLSEPLEYVPVEPGHAYHFRAFIRTQDITTESGMLFSLSDPNHGNALSVNTDNLVSTNPWTAADADFTTGPQTHFVVICLRREPSRLFENKLGGVVSIADISLVLAPAVSESPSK
jgi:tetratricopeptide (TPR) repeat protein